MGALASPQFVKALENAADVDQWATITRLMREGREHLLDPESVDVDAAFEIAEAAVERAFHRTGVAEYLEYYQL